MSTSVRTNTDGAPSSRNRPSAADLDALRRQNLNQCVVDRVLQLPAVHEQGLADAVDAYCETIAFDAIQVAKLFRRAQALGFPVKLHADQLSDCGGAELAAHFGALSADHLEYTSDRGVRAMAAAGTIAVLLPGAFLTLKESQLPPVAAMREAGVPIAIATDCNPGTWSLFRQLATRSQSAAP